MPKTLIEKVRDHVVTNHHFDFDINELADWERDMVINSIFEDTLSHMSNIQLLETISKVLEN